jgi:adenylylsulfate kinase
MVIWITGLSGAGKSTLAQEVVNFARKRISNVVLLDGDMVREVFGNDLGHSIQARKKNADRLCGLGKLLDDQGIHVVCAVLSIFSESREWNRKHLNSYYEVFIDTPIDSMIQRDVKGLYKRALAGEIELPGVNMAFSPPEQSDLVISNAGSLDDFMKHASHIAEQLILKELQ